MKIFKVVKKLSSTDPNHQWWKELTLLIVAADFASAEDKANNFEPDHKVSYIQEVGETTKKNDVYKLNDRL